MKTEAFFYDDDIVKKFLWATLFWGAIGLLVGVLIATQLVWPVMNFDTSWLTYGRLRPLHTNAVIFAFCGNAIFAGVYHSSQRLLKARMWSDALSKFHFWGWQLIIVSAALTLPLGFTSSKEYAELEWPIDLAIALVWVVFAINYLMTLKKRREQVLYVSIWFYLATIITIAMLHIVNSLALPVAPLKSYSIYSGVQDALVQWWYGHNAVAFFLTTPFLGLVYYYLPKAIGKPIYSYRLSIIHFWSLIFIYIWAGPHHLLYSALPEWLQSVGLVFSIMLLAPSWGGAINFILTMKQDWASLKSDPIVKFFAAATTFYMMATFEGPLLSIKTVNALSHNTDWTIAHVHAGTLGWNGFVVFGMTYYLLPRLYRTKLHSQKWANTHFWVSMLGILLYILSMWAAGAIHGLMAQKIDGSGVLAYPNFVEIVTAIRPLHIIRAIGGALYLSGLFLMVWNLALTVKHAPKNLALQVVSAPPLPESRNMVFSSWHSCSENWSSIMVTLVTVVVAIGGLLEMLPLFSIEPKSISISTVKPYSALELEGRDIYIREGCNNCHTQQVRPLVHETTRYGEPSKAGEFVNDYPHLWGSKRTGPDLHRVGGKYNDVWQWKHMLDPRSIVPDSIMPAYKFLAESALDDSKISAKISAMRTLGVRYSVDDIKNARADLHRQAKEIASRLTEQGEVARADSELVALIAYLQRLGIDIKAKPTLLQDAQRGQP